MRLCRDTTEKLALKQARFRREIRGDDEEFVEERWRPFAREVDRFVGNRIRAARHMARLTQDALSTAVGMPQSRLHRLEFGRQPTKVSELIRIAISTGQPLGFFLEPPPDPEIVRTGWEPLHKGSIWETLDV